MTGLATPSWVPPLSFNRSSLRISSARSCVSPSGHRNCTNKTKPNRSMANPLSIFDWFLDSTRPYWTRLLDAFAHGGWLPDQRNARRRIPPPLTAVPCQG